MDLNDYTPEPICATSRLDPAEYARLRAQLYSPDKSVAEHALNLLAKASMLEIRENSMPQVEALMAAGWLFQSVGENDEPWQWAWRRPKRRKKSKGMRFASTNQAYQALRRENPELPAIYH